MSFSVSYSSNIVCITPRLDAILSEKSGRGFSRFWFRGIKASAEERDITICRRQEVFIFGVRSVLGVRNVHGSHPGILSHKFHYFIKYFLISFERIRGGGGVRILTRLTFSCGQRKLRENKYDYSAMFLASAIIRERRLHIYK